MYPMRVHKIWSIISGWLSVICISLFLLLSQLVTSNIVGSIRAGPVTLWSTAFPMFFYFQMQNEIHLNIIQSKQHLLRTMENHTSQRIYRRFTSVNATAFTVYISIPEGSLRGDAPGSNVGWRTDYYHLVVVSVRQMTVECIQIN